MEQLKNRIDSRLNDKFFSPDAQAILDSKDFEASKNAIETDFWLCTALQRAQAYINTSFLLIFMPLQFLTSCLW